MTDTGGPQRRTLCFLSMLLSQKVPEKSDTVLRCIISGQPKPEVTWYKNGQTIEEGDIISSYEFFENQYIHVLHLYGKSWMKSGRPTCEVEKMRTSLLEAGWVSVFSVPIATELVSMSLMGAEEPEVLQSMLRQRLAGTVTCQ